MLLRIYKNSVAAPGGLRLHLLPYNCKIDFVTLNIISCYKLKTEDFIQIVARGCILEKDT